MNEVIFSIITIINLILLIMQHPLPWFPIDEYVTCNSITIDTTQNVYAQLITLLITLMFMKS